MKIIVSEENLLKFDNGLVIAGIGDIDCCANNYLDFEQFVVGQEFTTITAGEFIDAVNLKKDGFALTASDGTPKWCQARSEQTGYYSDRTELNVTYNGKTVSLGDLAGEQ